MGLGARPSLPLNEKHSFGLSHLGWKGLLVSHLNSNTLTLCLPCSTELSSQTQSASSAAPGRHERALVFCLRCCGGPAVPCLSPLCPLKVPEDCSLPYTLPAQGLCFTVQEPCFHYSLLCMKYWPQIVVTFFLTLTKGDHQAIRVCPWCSSGR